MNALSPTFIVTRTLVGFALKAALLHSVIGRRYPRLCLATSAMSRATSAVQPVW